jgi:hypothetical protein
VNLERRPRTVFDGNHLHNLKLFFGLPEAHLNLTAEDLVGWRLTNLQPVMAVFLEVGEGLLGFERDGLWFHIFVVYFRERDCIDG